MSKFKSKCYFEVGNNIDLTHKHPPLQLYEHYRHCYSDSLSPIVLMQYLDVPHWYQNIGLVSSDYMIHGCLRLCGHLHFWAPMFFRLSLILRSFLLFGLSPFFWGIHHFWVHLRFWGSLHFWDHLHFDIVFQNHGFIWKSIISTTQYQLLSFDFS